MSYLPIARKYRPKTFDEVKGQDHVRDALMASVKLDRIPHAIILTGIRGVGKTTLARLFATALNCQKGPTDEPCGECESCVSIATGSHVDVMEVDGASNTGVDDIREIQETVYYAPQASKYKVYMIDEVHMLSTSAFNALLKTLEEPPAQVVFIFATTELHKVPNTIISRCQSYSLRKVDRKLILESLTAICQQENMQYEEEALNLIVDSSEGSMRDAQTNLDQAYVLCNGDMTVDKIQKFFAVTGVQVIQDLCDAALSKQPKAVIDIVAKLHKNGVDFKKTTQQILKFINQKVKTDSNQQDQRWYALFNHFVQLHRALDGSVVDPLVFENNVLEWMAQKQVQTPQVQSVGASSSASISLGGLKNGGLKNEPKKTSAPPNTHFKNKMASQPLAEQQAEKQQAAPQRPAPEAIKSKLSVTGLKQPVQVQKTEPDAETLPPTWRAMVEAWKKLKPLQGRQLEDLYPLQYDQNIIELAVPEKTMAASGLLQPDSQKRMLVQMKHLFGFQGRLNVVLRESTAVSEPKHEDPQELKVGQDANDQHNLVDVRHFEKNAQDEALKKEARDHPLTQKLLNEFGLNIDRIDISEP